MKLLLIGLLLVGMARLDAMAAGSDFKGVVLQTRALLQKKDYEGLEKLVSQIKQRGYDIRQDETELEDFYGALLDAPSSNNAQWQDRLNQLNDWNTAIPDSLTAKIAIAKWHDGTAWRARGIGMGNSVTDGAGNIIDQQMKEAAAILNSASSGTIDDPEYYDEWISICLLTGPDKSVTKGYFDKGVAIAKEYFPLYDAMTNYLLPRWYGDAGEDDTFITTSAQGFPADKADVLYAYMTYEDVENTGGNFFKQSSLDYNRAKNGYFSMMGGETPAQWNKESEFREWQHENHLAVLAAFKGDKPLLRTLFLDLAGNIQTKLYYTKQGYLDFWRRSGAQAAMDRVIGFEKDNKMGRAEKMLISFTQQPAMYPPLAMFYERQGMKDKLAAMTIVISGKTPGDAMNTPIDQAERPVLAEMAAYYPLMGEWDKGEAAAKRFDQIRPDNLIGKNMMLLCAINKGDTKAEQDVIQSILGMTVEHPSYQIAQQVLSGKQSWEDCEKQMDPADIYLGQGVTAMALYYVTKGQLSEARNLIDFALPKCDDNSGKSILQSMEFGTLSRSVKAFATPTPAPAASVTPPAWPTPSTPPSSVSGTN